MLSLFLLAGIWTTTCIQTQINNQSGYVQEKYIIGETGNYYFEREWFEDAKCTAIKSVDSEDGSLSLGKKMSGIFVSGETFEADFTSASGKDLGAIQVNANSLKFARGLKNSTMRNTMVGFFEYQRQ